MKKIIIIAFIVVILLGASIFIYKNYDGTKSISTEASPNTSLAFSVVGDIHNNTDSFQTVINDMRSINSKMDALIMNGDSVDQGIDRQYEDMKKVLSKNSSKLPKTVIKNIGNHEFFDYDNGTNDAEDVKTFINRYLDFAGEKTVYHDKWVKGYHFISLGSEDGNSDTINAVKAYISDEQLRWFKEKLAENYEPKKPIFVFLHQHVSSSNKGWVGSDQSQPIIELLSQYPEVVIFTSHTHADFASSNVTSNQPFTMSHTGAVDYTLKQDGNGGRQRVSDIYGLYVEVFENKVVIKGRDVKNKSWVFTKEINNQ
jgi:3',5'-cyclic AMP phosphodiesterase CpdA